MEYIFHNAIAALAECNNMTLLSINRPLTDPVYRRWVIRQTSDPFTRDSGTRNMRTTMPDFDEEYVAKRFVDLAGFEVFVRLHEDARPLPAFRATTCPPLDLGKGRRQKLLARSGGRFTTKRERVEQKLPGSPTSAEVQFGADNDYYFAGVYSTAISSTTAFYGPYAPAGIVSANEEGAERAHAAADNDLRVHFNLPTSLASNHLLSITFDASNLHIGGGADPRYGNVLYFNGVLVSPSEILIRPADLGTDYTTAQFTLASVNAVTGPGFDNVISLRGINYNASGGGNWMGLDYIRLDSQIPEPSSALMVLFGAMGLTPLLRRRRA